MAIETLVWLENTVSFTRPGLEMQASFARPLVKDLGKKILVKKKNPYPLITGPSGHCATPED